jgi:dihydroorotase-like cyclic amidohydrolase
MTELITLPGLIDVHVHLRDPGQTHKEDFYSGTSAALAGGFTTVLDMPNNAEPIITKERLAAKIASAKKQIVCDIGFHFGTLGDNLHLFDEVIDQICGLKIYLNVTTGNFIIDHAKLAEIYKAWPGGKPILLHAEDDVAELVTSTLRNHPKQTHICHVSSQEELEFVIRAKEEGLPITCGVAPHHLFLTADDETRLGPYGKMKPSLKSKADQKFLWDHLDAIDVFESDHAPHTNAEKVGDPPPFGVPGLETTLSLLLTAEQEGKLTRQQLLDRLHHTPAKIFNLAIDPKTQVDVLMEEYEVKNEDLKTKAGWSPFDGQRVIGKVAEVRLHGRTAYKNGEVIAKPGSGRIIS